MRFFKLILRIGIIILVIFMILMVMVIFVDSFTYEKMGYKEVDCYDKSGNRIQELTCEEIVFCGVITKRTNKPMCYENLYKISKEDTTSFHANVRDRE